MGEVIGGNMDVPDKTDETPTTTPVPVTCTPALFNSVPVPPTSTDSQISVPRPTAPVPQTSVSAPTTLVNEQITNRMFFLFI